MSIEQSIRTLWSAQPSLTSLVPLASFWTGVAPSTAEQPFVVLSKPLVETKLRTSVGRTIEEANLRLTVVSQDLDEAQEVAEEIERHYEGESLPLDDGSILDIRRTRREEKQTEDHHWQVTISLRALVERTQSVSDE